MVDSLWSILFPPNPGQSREYPIRILAVPGLTTFLDVGLFKANEGQLTATICSSHSLISCWIEIKRQSQFVLQGLKDEPSSPAKLMCESFCRQCLESSMDAIERMSTEKLSQSANLSDPYSSMSATAGSNHGLLSGVGVQGIATGILESKKEYGRRYPFQRVSDCWESARLFCPDYVWADETYLSCQRWLRSLIKHPFVLRERDNLATPLSSSSSSGGGGGGNHHPNNSNSSSGNNNNHSSYQSSVNQPLSPMTERQASVLVQLIQSDLGMRLYHFRQAMDADAVVTKRLHLVKCEYRGPFRHFLEAHQSLLRAPSTELVDHKLKGALPDVETLRGELQSLLKTPQMVEIFALEREAEQLELEIGQTLFPFSELARSLDHKKAILKVVPGVLEEEDLPALQETVRVRIRKKSSFCCCKEVAISCLFFFFFWFEKLTKIFHCLSILWYLLFFLGRD